MSYPRSATATVRPCTVEWLRVITVSVVVALFPAVGVAQSRPFSPTTSVIVVRDSWAHPVIEVISAKVSPEQRDTGRSAGRIVLVHTAVGAAAGLLIGVALSGASVDDNRVGVILPWTAIGAAAGVISGLLTSALTPRE